jgi:ABC-type Na+ transport system ATPase subunit NatA
MIEAKHLTKRYGTTVAVNDVCFTVKPGQVRPDLVWAVTAFDDVGEVL